MGCEVVSVYADESTGMTSYPQSITVDLYTRNYSPGNLLKTVPQTHPYYILGFTQSFAQAKLFTYTLKGLEYFIYASGRYLVVSQCPGSRKGELVVKEHQNRQRAIMHEDRIVGLEAKGKLCLTGTVGGRIVLWDLEFFQQKVSVRLPEPAMNISSLSMSDDYIFCTDTQMPHNYVHCFDIRTCKLKALSQIPSYQPVLKGINWTKTQHITASADGLWFSKFSASTSSFQITKGMFRISPKTAMTCLCVVDDLYVISGTVDGYVFLWAHYQVQKVLKVGDSGVSEMMLSGNKLILGNFANNVRVFQFTIKKKVKMQEDEQKNGEITEDFVSVIIDSYQRQSLQSIAISKLDQSIYYAQTRTGILYNKMIPSAEYQNKMKNYKDMDKKIMEYEQDTTKSIYRDEIWFMKHNKPFFQIKKMETQGAPETWRVQSRYISNAKKYIAGPDNILYHLLPQILKVVYVGKGKIHICEIADIEVHPDTKIDQLKQSVILEFEPEGPNSLTVRGLTSFQVKEQLYIMIFFETEFAVLKRDGEKWTNVMAKQYEKEIVKEITIEGEIVKFEQRNNAYRWVNPNATAEMKEKMSFMHCVHELEDMEKLGSGKILSLGGSSAIIK